jgi:hypothetical protein
LIFRSHNSTIGLVDIPLYVNRIKGVAINHDDIGDPLNIVWVFLLSSSQHMNRDVKSSNLRTKIRFAWSNKVASGCQIPKCWYFHFSPQVISKNKCILQDRRAYRDVKEISFFFLNFFFVILFLFDLTFVVFVVQ